MKSWQRYYRPTSFSQLHLVKVREIMQRFADNGGFPQVLLFAGPKGVGKTSTARIIAATVNSPLNQQAVKNFYLQNKKTATKSKLADPEVENSQIKQILQGESYLVVEMDAASNRGIDDVRSLSEKIYLPPAMGQMMVYILDEVHMFTNEAFNALLKILEEPPKHAIFILATTEMHKIPATVISRCQVVNFTKANLAELITALEHICQQEKLKVDKKALEKIAQSADGSFRDAVKYLQLVATQGAVTLERVEQLLSSNQQTQIQQLIKIFLQKDLLGLTTFFAELRSQVVDEKAFLTNLANFLYEQLLANLKGEKQLLLKQNQAQFLLNQLSNLSENHYLPFLNLELALITIISKTKK